jgi:hypothetical protein
VDGWWLKPHEINRIALLSENLAFIHVIVQALITELSVVKSDVKFGTEATNLKSAVPHYH